MEENFGVLYSGEFGRSLRDSFGILRKENYVGKFLGGIAVTLGVLTVVVAYKVGFFDKLEEFIDDISEEAKVRFVGADEDEEVEVEEVVDDL